VGSKTLYQQNPPPVLNWRCRLTQVDLYNGRRTVVAVVVLSVEPPCTSALNVTLPAGRPRSTDSRYAASAADDQCLLPAPELQQTSCTLLRLTIDGTDGRTPDVTETLTACCIRAASVNNQRAARGIRGWAADRLCRALCLVLDGSPDAPKRGSGR